MTVSRVLVLISEEVNTKNGEARLRVEGGTKFWTPGSHEPRFVACRAKLAMQVRRCSGNVV